MGVVEGAFEQRSTRDIIIMAREINMDTMRQNFWAESIKKETQMRRSWYSTHQSKEQSTKAWKTQTKSYSDVRQNYAHLCPRQLIEKLKDTMKMRLKLNYRNLNAHRIKWRNAPILCTPSTTRSAGAFTMESPARDSAATTT